MAEEQPQVQETAPASAATEPISVPVKKRLNFGGRVQEAEARAEEREIKRGRGNPNLVKGKYPYCVEKGSFERWLADNPSYDRKSVRKSSEIVRMFLEEMVTKSGKPAQKDSVGRERLELLLKAVFRTATNDKSRNQIAAAQLLMMYGLGKPQASEADLDAIKKGGLTLVYVNRPAIDSEIPVAPAGELTSGTPEFIDAEYEDANG